MSWCERATRLILGPVDRSLFGAHFYAPFKWLAGERVPTLYANTLVLWSMTTALHGPAVVGPFPEGGKSASTARPVEALNRAYGGQSSTSSISIIRNGTLMMAW